MSIKKASKIGGAVCFVCIFILIFCTVQVIRSIEAMEDFAQKRIDSMLLAQEVRATSSGLTANARSYVSTGEPAYERAYWDLVKIRAGELPRPARASVAPGETIPMNTLLERAGFTDEELALLAESVRISGALVLIEERAMNAIKGILQDSSGAYGPPGSPDPELARSLMFGEEYDAIVEKIMVPSYTFDKMVTQRINIQAAEVMTSLDRAIAALCGAIAIMTIFLAFGLYMLLRRIMEPVSASAGFAQAVAEGRLDTPAPAFTFSTDNEIGQMLSSLKLMVTNIKERIALAESKSREAEEQGKKATWAMEEALQAQRAAEFGQQAILAAAGNVEQVVSRLSSATEELSAQVDESTKSTDKQRELVSSSARAMKQMNSTVLEVAKGAEAAAEESTSAREKARHGDEIVRQSVESMVTVQHDTRELKNNMEDLGRRAESVGNIITVISDIADQTNLLALNAAIEAARAGDAGRGFAVVADEVRKLAEKTMAATREVGDTITGIQAYTRQSIDALERTTGNLDSATELVKRSGDALSAIVQGITETASQVSVIAAAAKEQSAASEEITRSQDEINTIAKGTMEAMVQASQAVSELTGQAHQLLSLVEELRKK